MPKRIDYFAEIRRHMASTDPDLDRIRELLRDIRSEAAGRPNNLRLLALLDIALSEATEVPAAPLAKPH